MIVVTVHVEHLLPSYSDVVAIYIYICIPTIPSSQVSTFCSFHRLEVPEQALAYLILGLVWKINLDVRVCPHSYYYIVGSSSISYNTQP